MIKNPVAKFSPKVNKPKTFRDKKNDYKREKYSYSNSPIYEPYKYPDV